jgi:hypothetical protein
MRSPHHKLLLIVFLLSVARPAKAQDVIVDWSTQSLTSSPTKVYKTMVVNVRLNNANNLLYDYKIDITATPRSQDDFGKIADLLTKSPAAAAAAVAAAAPTSCQTAIQNAKQALTTVNNVITAKNTPINPDEGSGKFSSVKVDKTIAYWKSTVQPQDDAAKQAIANLNVELSKPASTCSPADIQGATDLTKTYGAFRAFADDFESRLDKSHDIMVPVTLSPENDYKIVVTELYEGKATEGGTQSFTFSPASDILTLSAGALLTTIQNRTYTSGTLPGQTGNFLVVGGQSPIRPILVAQLNYRLPWLSRDEIGLAVSSGAAIQFTSGSSGVSNAGFFGGLSVHLWNRFYLTPGIHVGEFADFPAGFTGPNQPIPTGFGQLTPNKRWTARFAFGITYKAIDFSKFTSSTSSKK